MPLEIVVDYRTALEGEALIAKNPPTTQSVSDAPPGFTEETVTEVIEF